MHPLKPGGAAERRSLSAAKRMDQLYLELRGQPFERCEREYLKLGAVLLREARTDLQKREAKRRVAEEILMAAYMRRCGKAEFSRALRRVTRLGYTALGQRVHVACLYVLASQQFPERTEAALRWLDEAERRAKSLRSNSELREQFMTSIQSTRSRSTHR